jgi:hypothetical protein
LQDLECNKYNPPQWVAGDENDGKKEVINSEAVVDNSSQKTTEGNVVNTQSSIVEIKRFKETSV